VRWRCHPTEDRRRSDRGRRGHSLGSRWRRVRIMEAQPVRVKAADSHRASASERALPFTTLPHATGTTAPVASCAALLEKAANHELAPSVGRGSVASGSTGELAARRRWLARCGTGSVVVCPRLTESIRGGLLRWWPWPTKRHVLGIHTRHFVLRGEAEAAATNARRYPGALRTASKDNKRNGTTTSPR